MKGEVHRWSSHPNLIQPSPSPYSHPTTLISFSGSLLFFCWHQHLYHHSLWWPQLSLWARKCHLLFLATTRADSPWKHKRMPWPWGRTAIGKGKFWNTNEEGDGIINPWQDLLTMCQQSLTWKLLSLSWNLPSHSPVSTIKKLFTLVSIFLCLYSTSLLHSMPQQFWPSPWPHHPHFSSNSWLLTSQWLTARSSYSLYVQLFHLRAPSSHKNIL